MLQTKTTGNVWQFIEQCVETKETRMLVLFTISILQ